MHFLRLSSRHCEYGQRLFCTNRRRSSVGGVGRKRPHRGCPRGSRRERTRVGRPRGHQDARSCRERRARRRGRRGGHPTRQTRDVRDQGGSILKRSEGRARRCPRDGERARAPVATRGPEGRRLERDRQVRRGRRPRCGWGLRGGHRRAVRAARRHGHQPGRVRTRTPARDAGKSRTRKRTRGARQRARGFAPEVHGALRFDRSRRRDAVRAQAHGGDGGHGETRRRPSDRLKLGASLRRVSRRLVRRGGSRGKSQAPDGGHGRGRFPLREVGDRPGGASANAGARARRSRSRRRGRRLPQASENTQGIGGRRSVLAVSRLRRERRRTVHDEGDDPLSGRRRIGRSKVRASPQETPALRRVLRVPRPQRGRDDGAARVGWIHRPGRDDRRRSRGGILRRYEWRVGERKCGYRPPARSARLAPPAGGHGPGHRQALASVRTGDARVRLSGCA